MATMEQTETVKGHQRGNEAASSGPTSPPQNKKYLLIHCSLFTEEECMYSPNMHEGRLNIHYVYDPTLRIKEYG